MSLRFARQYVLEEIGTAGQARLEAASVRAGSGDARAHEIALAYVTRAGVAHDASGDPLDVATSDEIARVAGRPELEPAAAFLLGALAATERIAAIAGAPARKVGEVPALVGAEKPARAPG
ncbi:MAG: hypothetical protein U0234_06485 [Sandaracinus sp.]